MPTTPQVRVPEGEKTKATYKDVRPYVKDEDARKTISEYHGTPLGYTRLGTLPYAVRQRVLPEPPDLFADPLIHAIKGKNPVQGLSDAVRGFGNERKFLSEWSKRNDVPQGEFSLSPTALTGAMDVVGDAVHALENNRSPERVLAQEATDAVARSRRRKAFLDGDLPARRYPMQLLKDTTTSVERTEDGGYTGTVKPIE